MNPFRTAARRIRLFFLLRRLKKTKEMLDRVDIEYQIAHVRQRAGDHR